MGYIGTAPLSGDYRKLDDISSGFDGVETTFVLQVGSVTVTPPKATAVIISVGGVLQEPISAYDISVSSIIFTAPPAAGADFFGVMLGIGVAIGTPGDGTVTLAKMAGGTAGNLTSFDASGDPVAVATGTAGQLLTSAGVGAPPTFVDAPPATTQTHNFVANGAITAGAPVALQSDGKVAAATSNTTVPAQFSSGISSGISGIVDTAYDTTNNKVLIVYSDGGNSNYGTAVVGTIAGGAITYGTPVVFASVSFSYKAVTFDSTNGVFVIGWISAGLKSVVATVSNTSVSFGTTVTADAATTVSTACEAVYASNSGDVVFMYYRSGGTHTVVGTVSGSPPTTISFGAVAIAEPYSLQEYPSNMAFDATANKVVIAGRFYVSYNNNANCIIGTIAGTAGSKTISFGTSVEIGVPTTSSTMQIAYSPDAGKCVIQYSAGSLLKASILTITGTTPSLSTAVDIGSGYSTNQVYDTTLNKFVSISRSSSNTTSIALGTISAGSLTYTAITEVSKLSPGSHYLTASVYDPDSNRTVISLSGGNVILYEADGDSNHGDWVGFADAAIADGATGAVRLLGSVAGSQSGLTAGSMCYLGSDALVHVGVETGREVGRAVSATEILITQPRVT